MRRRRSRKKKEKKIASLFDPITIIFPSLYLSSCSSRSRGQRPRRRPPRPSTRSRSLRLCGRFEKVRERERGEKRERKKKMSEQASYESQSIDVCFFFSSSRAPPSLLFSPNTPSMSSSGMMGDALVESKKGKKGCEKERKREEFFSCYKKK